MRNSEYAFITLDFNIEERYINGSYPHVSKEKLFATFEGVLDMAIGMPDSVKYNETTNELKTILKSKGLKIIDQVISGNINRSMYYLTG